MCSGPRGLVAYELFFVVLEETASGTSVWAQATRRRKDFLRLVNKEQLQARVTPKQAAPFLVQDALL